MPDTYAPAAARHPLSQPANDATSATLTLPGAALGAGRRRVDTPIDVRRPLLVCIGTRPEIIKMAPVHRALQEAGLPVRLVHTGQHRELAEPIYRALDLAPDHSLPLERSDDSIASLAAGLLRAIDPVLAQWQPAALLVHGDTSSAAMAALAGFWRGVPVAHVEAGLRSHQPRDPFPEELNRALIARVAHWHFAPTPAAVANLRAEGIAPRAIYQVGNTIVEATHQAFERLDPTRPLASNRPGSKLIVVTAHRRENWGAPIRGFLRALGAVLSAHPDLEVVWTLHGNQALARDVRAAHAELPQEPAARLHLVPPLDYLRMIALLRAAWLVLTDSGGIQEEACALRVPVLVLRHSTERPELIEAGAGRLIGTDPLRVAAEIERLWREPDLHRAMQAATNPFGDGSASRRIAAVLGQWYARLDQPDAAARLGAAPPPAGSPGLTPRPVSPAP
jgi:UDP-N-acetylglucosamine 2-epimerase (non-hydrolysing)